MTSSVRLNFERVETSRDMVNVLEQERSSTQQQNLDSVKEKNPLHWTEKGLSFQDKHRFRHSFSQSYLDMNCESRHNASSEKVTRSKYSENDRKPQFGGRACDDNELVKHMSSLPGFLLKVEKENTVQEKALNFGVLDWKNLEKWKYTESIPGKLPKKTSYSGNSFYSASRPPKMQQVSHFSSPQRRPLPSKSSYLNSSNEERNSSYQKEEKYAGYMKSKGKETCNQEYQAAESVRIGGQLGQFQQRVKFYGRSCSERNGLNNKRQDPEKEMMAERGTSSSSSKQGKHKISLLSPNKISAQGKKSEMRFDEVKLTADPQDTVLEVPKNFHEKNCSEGTEFSESRTSLDAQLSAVTENRLSDFISPQELYSGELSGDIPHSCPLPSTADELPNLLCSRATDADIFPSADPVTSISSEAKCSVMNEGTPRSSILIEAPNRKQAGIAGQPTVKGRSPSPTRRFSFNLGRMSRSFSFKESSAVPQLSSTYTTENSGSVKPEVGPGTDHCERDQANASSRGQSSPLRRLLDPLLKHKTTFENAQPLNGSLRSLSISSTITKGPSKDRKPEASTFQALLQLTFTNGLPSFKLVVENSKDMLAAAVKRFPTSGKSDPCIIYSFYSVHEIRKKGMNWINHGSKSKSYSLGYNIIGQMRISNSYNLKVNIGDTSESDARECLLYSVDPAQVDKQMLELEPKKEIAAIVIKKFSEKVGDGKFMCKNQLFEGKEFPQRVSALALEKEVMKTSNGTVVILPGGVHGMPIQGAPSSLISRWISGGSCDCGGWDVGCMLRILSDSGKGSNILQESISSSVDHVYLYEQGGRQKSKPVFSLKPFSSEFYYIELDASISLLEAFAISVAYVTCLKLPQIIDVKGQFEAERSPEANIGTDKSKTPAASQKQLPVKYVTCPPLSPVGRI